MQVLKEFILKKVVETFVTEENIKKGIKTLITYLRELAQKTENKLDDMMVDTLEDALMKDASDSSDSSS